MVLPWRFPEQAEVDSHPRFSLAAAGWDHDRWQGVIYPDDLPSDWRLAYYANAFDAVLVPAAQWPAATGDELACWVADTPPAFRFYLDWVAAPGGPPCRGWRRSSAAGAAGCWRRGWCRRPI